jgi:NAD(P)H-hydrate epimerase
MQSEISYVNADLAKLIDDRLMSSPGYTLDQLMELAGYSVACAAYDILHGEDSQIKRKPIYIFCGPGNNGGDGLVAARHLKHFGYSPSIIYPKQSNGEIFSNLIHQLHGLEIPILTESPDTTTLAESALLIDSLFGFSFKGPSREPYSSIINQFRELQSLRPILSIDIPSGWDVNEGDIYSSGFLPSSTISLSTPKLCMRMYPGDHYVGGRFIPPSLAQELKLILPDYGDNVSQIVKLPKNSVGKASAAVCNAEISKVEKVVAIYSTASSSEEAKLVAHHLISQKLAACVNIIPQIQSVYEWEGKVEDSTEYLLMIKVDLVLLCALP